MMASLPQLLILLAVLVLPVLVFGPVARKAGFSVWWSLLMIIPFVNIAVIWAFAFMQWPAGNGRNR